MTMNLFVLRTWLQARFAKDEDGASMVEYILLVALIALAVIAAVNSVIAFFYYFGVVRTMWFDEPAEDTDRSAIRVPAALAGAIAMMGTIVVIIGIYPQLFARIGDRAF